MSFIGQSIESLPTPAFVVDRAAVASNCARMLERAASAGVELRAQVKTHKTVEGAVMQTGGTKRWAGHILDETFCRNSNEFRIQTFKNTTAVLKYKKQHLLAPNFQICKTFTSIY